MAKPRASVRGAAAPKAERRPLNFRVSDEFDRKVRLTALNRRMKLQDLLVAAFEAYWRQEGSA